MPEDKPRAAKNGKDDADGPMRIQWLRLLCWLGFHRFRVIVVTFGFGSGGRVERVGAGGGAGRGMGDCFRGSYGCYGFGGGFVVSLG